MPTSRDTNTETTQRLTQRLTQILTSTRPSRPGGLTIDCDCCALRHTVACDDCVVSFLLEREPDDAVVIDADEAWAMRMLEHAGLVPTLRFSTQTG